MMTITMTGNDWEWVRDGLTEDRGVRIGRSRSAARNIIDKIDDGIAAEGDLSAPTPIIVSAREAAIIADSANR